MCAQPTASPLGWSPDKVFEQGAYHRHIVHAYAIAQDVQLALELPTDEGRVAAQEALALHGFPGQVGE